MLVTLRYQLINRNIIGWFCPGLAGAGTGVLVIKRSMKSSRNSTNLLNNGKQVLFAGNVQKTFDMYATKITTQQQYIDQLTDQYKIPGENITTQSLLYAFSPRFSTKKSDLIASFKSSLSSKVVVDNPSEKGNVSFLTELVTASRYADTSDCIQQVRLNSENTSVITSTKSGSNMYSDLTISYVNSNGIISLLKDIKSGNNMQRITTGVIAEIPYISCTEPFSIMNQPKDLLELSKLRINMISNKSFEENKADIDNIIANINRLDPLIDQCHLQYNILLQEELYKALSIPALRRINMSYYYGVIVKEYETNPDFFRRLQPYINNRIFDSKKDINAFLAKAAIIYHETINPIIQG